jgi:hypothetical protein
VALDSNVIEGYCHRCLAGVAFGPEQGWDSAAEQAGPRRRVGNYELFEEIGRGERGIVYRARQAGLDRDVAVKVLRGAPLADAAEFSQFLRDATAAAALQHPNILPVQEIGEAEGALFVVMELVRGGTLADLTRHGPLEPRRAADCLRAITQAVAVAHAHGLFHRRLKPSCVLIDETGRPRVTGFGQGNMGASSPDPWPRDRAPSQQPTAPDRRLDSPGFLAPEAIARERGPVTVASDVYSLGTLLHFLLTGRPPVAEISTAAPNTETPDERRGPLRRWNPSVPHGLETICLKCLQVEPTHRYPTAAALADDLEAFLERRPIRVRPVSCWQQIVLWARRKPAQAALLLLLQLALIAAALGGLWQWRRVTRAESAARLNANLNTTPARFQQVSRAEPLLPQSSGSTGAAVQAPLASNAARSDTAGHDGALSIWERGEPIRLNPIELPAETVIATLLSTETLALFERRSNGLEVVRRSVDGSRRQALGRVPNRKELRVSPDGSRFGSITEAGTLELWTLEPLRRTATAAPDADDELAWLAFAPSGASLISYSQNGVIAWWSAQDLKLLHQLPGNPQPIYADDERFVASKDEARSTLVLRRRADGEVIARLASRRSNVRMSVGSPDSQWLASVAQDGGVRLWRLRDGQPGPELQAQRPGVSWCSFSPDGITLAACSDEGTVRLWQVATGRLLAELNPGVGALQRVRFSRDGQALCATAATNGLPLWLAPTLGR